MLFMRILLDLEEHFLRKEMISPVHRANIDIVAKSHASLTYMCALCQNHAGFGTVLSISEGFRKGYAVIMIPF